MLPVGRRDVDRVDLAGTEQVLVLGVIIDFGAVALAEVGRLVGLLCRSMR